MPGRYDDLSPENFGRAQGAGSSGRYDDLSPSAFGIEVGDIEAPRPGVWDRYGRPALDVFGSVVGAPKRAVDWLSRTGAKTLYGLDLPEDFTTGKMVRAAAGLNPEETNSVAGRIGGRALEFGTDLATDPLTFAIGGAGKLAKVAGLGFTGMMGAGAIEEGGQAYRTLKDEGFTPKAAEELFGTALSAGGAVLGASHALPGLTAAARIARRAGRHAEAERFEAGVPPVAPPGAPAGIEAPRQIGADPLAGLQVPPTAPQAAPRATPAEAVAQPPVQAAPVATARPVPDQLLELGYPPELAQKIDPQTAQAILATGRQYVPPRRPGQAVEAAPPAAVEPPITLEPTGQEAPVVASAAVREAPAIAPEAVQEPVPRPEVPAPLGPDEALKPTFLESASPEDRAAYTNDVLETARRAYGEEGNGLATYPREGGGFDVVYRRGGKVTAAARVTPDGTASDLAGTDRVGAGRVAKELGRRQVRFDENALSPDSVALIQKRKASPALRDKAALASPEVLAQRTGLTPDEAARGARDVVRDAHYEFSPEALAVKKALQFKPRSVPKPAGDVPVPLTLDVGIPAEPYTIQRGTPPEPGNVTMANTGGGPWKAAPSGVKFDELLEAVRRGDLTLEQAAVLARSPEWEGRVRGAEIREGAITPEPQRPPGPIPEPGNVKLPTTGGGKAREAPPGVPLDELTARMERGELTMDQAAEMAGGKPPVPEPPQPAATDVRTPETERALHEGMLRRAVDKGNAFDRDQARQRLMEAEGKPKPDNLPERREALAEWERQAGEVEAGILGKPSASGGGIAAEAPRYATEAAPQGSQKYHALAKYSEENPGTVWRNKNGEVRELQFTTDENGRSTGMVEGFDENDRPIAFKSSEAGLFEIATGKPKSYWRVQHMKDPTTKEWRSQIGHDEDGLGRELGTSSFDTFAKLQDWARGGHADLVGDLAIVELNGKLVGRGTDGESLIIPSREVRRIPISGGIGRGRIGETIQSVDPFDTITAESPRFAAGEPTPGPAITTKHVERAFPTGKVADAGDGAWDVRLPGNRNIRVQTDGSIEYNPEAMRAGYGREKGPGEEIVGSYQRIDREGVIRLAKEGATEGTLSHEVLHSAMDLALSNKEKAAILKRYGSEEAAADAYSKWEPAQGGNGLFAKIAQFFRNIYRSFQPSAESAFGRVKSGEAWGKPDQKTGRKFSSTQVDLPPEIGSRLREMSAKIPDEDLSTDPNGAGRESDPHITVKFGVHSNDPAQVQAALAGEGPVRVRLGETSLFPAKEGAAYDVVKLDVDSPDLHRLNRKISDAVETTDTHPAYEPHATLAYVKPGRGQKYVGDRTLAGTETTLDRITLSTRDGRDVPIPLAGKPKYATAPAEPPPPAERKIKPIPPGAKPVAPDKALGRSMEPGEAPRVESKVADLKAGAPGAKLSRDAPRTWESLDPEIRSKLDAIEADPAKELALYERARSGRINDVEVQTLDALVAGKKEGYDTARHKLLKAQEAGRDTGPENVHYLQAALDQVTADLARAARSDVEAGTKLGRALAARARVMDAAGKSTPDQFLKKVFREIEGVSDQQAGDLLKVLQERPQDLSDALHGAMKPKGIDKFLEWWKAGLVSGPGTQVGNILGNVGEQIMRLGETATAAAIDPFLGGGKTRLRGEARAELAGAMRGAGKGLGRLGTDLKDILTMAPERIDLSKPLEHQVGAIGGTKGRVIRTPFRLLGAFDDFFKSLGGEAELHKLAFRRAQGDRATARKIIDNPPTDILEQVTASRQARTFQDPNKLAQSLINFRSQNKWAHIVMPFVQTPANIAAMTLKRSPAGFILGEGNAAKALLEYRRAVKGGAAPERVAELKGKAVDALARPLLGTMLMGTFAAVAKSGGMTGSGPTDPKEKNLLRDSGWQPYSFVLPGPDGKKVYVPYNRFEPVSSLLGFAADMVEAGEAKQAGDLFDKGLGSIVENLTNKTYLNGLADAAEAITRPKEFLGQYSSNLAGSLVPTVVAKAAQAIDPKFRDLRPESTGFSGIPERIGKSVSARIPGLSTTLPSRASSTGEDIERPGNAVTRFLSPVQPSVSKEGGELAETLVRVGYPPPVPSRDITIRGRKVRLTDEEFEIMKTANKKASDRARRAMAQPSFMNLPDTIEEAGPSRPSKERIFRRYFEQERDRARERIGPRVLRRSQLEGRA